MSKYTMKFLSLITSIIGLVFSQSVLAAWTLNGDASHLYYVTSKAAAISELNSFAELSGTLGDDGQAEVIISLGSVDTAIDIRNERMRDIVFQVANYPLATISLTADSLLINSMALGENYIRPYEITVDLHGMQQTMTVEVSVTKLLGGGLQVALVKPLLVNAASFGLTAAVEELREIAGLPSINNTVVVDFTLQFDVDP